MKKIFKKNQIIITSLALMIAVAGYLQWTEEEIDDSALAQEASTELSEDTYEISDEDIFQVEDIFTDTSGDGISAAEAGAETAQNDVTGTEGTEGETITNPGEAVLTSSTVTNMNFAAEVKLNREQIRSKNKESLLQLMNTTGITEEQKQAAIDAMIQITDIAEREAAAEMLLEAKGFTDVVVSITDNSADVVLNMGDVTDAKRAQIEDIVKRKTNIAAENIIITPIQVTTDSE